MKYFIVSDIHGQYEKLLSALKEAKFDEHNTSHKLAVVGDFIDDGPQQMMVLRYFRELEKKGKAFVVRGNHEDYHLQRRGYMDRGLESEISFLHRIEGEDKTIEEFKEVIFNEIESYVSKLPYYIEKNTFILAHAGIDPTLPDWRKGPVGGWDWADTMSWMYKTHAKRVLDGEFKKIDKKVISGHLYALHYFFWEKNGLFGRFVKDAHYGEDHSLLGVPYKKDNFVGIDGMWHLPNSKGIVYIIEE